jgi:hypothetical protein
MEAIDTSKKLPKLVGTNFVKIFRQYILNEIEGNNIDEKSLVKKAFLEKNVKPDTTRKYISEMILLEIIKKDDNNNLSLA